MKQITFILSRSILTIVVLLITFFVSEWLGAMLFSDNMFTVIISNSVILLLFGFLFVYALYRFIEKKSMHSLGLSASGHIGEFWQGAFIAVSAIIVGFAFILLIGAITVESSQFRISYMSALLFSLLLCAYFEELVLRGYLLKVLTDKTKNILLSLSVSSLVFAIIHLNNSDVEILAVINILLAGFVLGLLYLQTKNMLLPVGFHFFWNFTQAILGFNVSGEEMPSILILQRNSDNIINGGEFGFENSIVCTLILVLLIIYFGYTNHKKSVSADF